MDEKRNVFFKVLGSVKFWHATITWVASPVLVQGLTRWAIALSVPPVWAFAGAVVLVVVLIVAVSRECFLGYCLNDHEALKAKLSGQSGR